MIDITQPDGVSYSDLKMKPTHLPAGTVVKTQTGGGGGYGDAYDRSEVLISLDIRDGYISIDEAEKPTASSFSRTAALIPQQLRFLGS